MWYESEFEQTRNYLFPYIYDMNYNVKSAIICHSD